MSIILKPGIILFLIFPVLICCAKPKAGGNTTITADSLMTKDNAMKVAQDTAKVLGYEVENMNSEVTFYDKPWNVFFPKECDYDYCIKRKKTLEGKLYWAVYFSPIQYQKGGDICVFVDTAAGNVLTLYRGK
jgi:hypothetical protein